MDITPSILDCIGNTPLIPLDKITAGENCARILAKAEFLSPTGSVKDRIAHHIIEQAEKSGDLRAGGTIVENTSGNTGLGLAMVAAVKGYKCVFTMPDKMSLEKVNMLKSFGAEVVITPTDVPGDDARHYVNVAKRIAGETPGGYYVNQYHTELNIDAHEQTTGREIYDQTDGGTFDAFVTTPGTGGTLSGVGRFLKKHAPNVKVVGCDPLGSVHFHYFHTGTMPTPYVYMVEGAGEDILCGAMDFSVCDDFMQVSDKESFLMARRLVREEGLYCGGSAGLNVHAALDIARELGPGKTVVTILCDSATRYTTKHLSDDWMRDHGFLEAGPDLGAVEDLLTKRGSRPVITTHPETTLTDAIDLLRENGISQVPLVNGTGRPSGIVHEVDILRGLHERTVGPDSPVSAIAHDIGGLVYPKARLEELYHIFESDQVAIVVDAGAVVGVISQIDLIEYLAAVGKRPQRQPATH